MSIGTAARVFEPLATSRVFPLEDCLVWLEPATGRVAVLNPTASLIWLLCEEGCSPPEIAAELAARCSAPLGQLHADVLSALDNWSAAGLLAGAGATCLDHAPSTESPCHRAAPAGLPAVTTTHCILDQVVEIRYFGADLVAFVEPWLRHWSSQPGADINHCLDVFQAGDDYCVSGPGLGPMGHVLPERLKTLVAGQMIQACLPSQDLFAILHAGAVGDGRNCVLLAGTSGAGKSTLTAALVHSGLSYLGDDLVPFNQRTSCAQPFPTAFSVKEGSWRTVSQLFPELDSEPAFQHEGQRVRYLPFESTTPATGRPVCGMIFPRYRAGSTTRVRPIGAAEAFQRLLASCSWLRPPVSLADFAGFLVWLEQLPCCELEYSALDEAIPLIRGGFPK